MNDLELKKKTETIINKEGKEISFDKYYVVINDIEVSLKYTDFTAKALLDNYFKSLDK